MKDPKMLSGETFKMVMNYLSILGDSLTSCMLANNEKSLDLGYHTFYPGFNLYGGVMTKNSLREALKVINLAIDYLRENSIIPPPIPDELEKWSYRLNVIDIEEEVVNFFEVRDKLFSFLYAETASNIINQIREVAEADDHEKKWKLALFLRAMSVGSMKRSGHLDVLLGKDVIEKLELGIKGRGLASYIVPPMDNNEAMMRRLLDPRK